jgi:curved DNA-binding protein CbpA
MATESPENLYAVLGVAKTATKEELQSAFKKKARELHPDVNKAPDAEERFKQLVGAYEILRDEEKRKRYDLFGGLNGNAQRPRPKYDTYQPPGGPGPRPSSTAGAPGAPGAAAPAARRQRTTSTSCSASASARTARRRTPSTTSSASPRRRSRRSPSARSS